jgi:nucleotide-binding universal stress UspA family protein
MADLIVLVAYDGSPGADAAIDTAATLFAAHDVTVVTVWQSAREVAPAAIVALPVQVIEDALVELDRAAEAAATEIAERGAQRLREHGVGVAVATAPASGSVWSTIDAQARERGAACVVVGSRGRSELASAVLGSVAQGLVHHGALPVVVVPARG